MARKKLSYYKQACQRIVFDPITRDYIQDKFIKYLMISGSKSLAEKKVYQTFSKLKERYKLNPVYLFHQALKNVMPLAEVKSIRLGGSTYKVPVELSFQRRIFLGMKWILEGARKQRTKEITDALIDEIAKAYQGTGYGIKKKEEIHKLVEANRSFSHYRW
jgi:small subunit ribosomal protein S7